MNRSPLNSGFRIFDWAGLLQRDLDIDDVDFMDPYPNPEETILAMEAAVCRGFWAFGTPREKIRTTKADRNSRKKLDSSDEGPPGA